jgi:hypothetical protein
MITFHGTVTVPPETIAYAEPIKHENYKVNNPGTAEFKVRALESADGLIKQLVDLIGVPKEKLDFVYFSCCAGAEPHTDKLDPAKFYDHTYVIPIILPKGVTTITADGMPATVHVGGVYKFDHTKTHSMEVEDKESGCVVVMVGVLKAEWLKAQKYKSKHAMGEIGYLITGGLNVKRVKVVELDITVQCKPQKFVGVAPVNADGKWHDKTVYITETMHPTFEDAMAHMLIVQQAELTSLIQDYHEKLQVNIVNSIADHLKPLPTE